MSPKLKVIQWGTGSMGRTCIRQIVDNGQFELVGAYVTNPKKVGLDAGAIAKRPNTGIIATNNIEEILAIDADVVLHTSLISIPYEAQNEHVIRLLESGKNVISPNGFYRPKIHGEAYSKPLREAAYKGNSTLAGIGLNPGFAAERMALTLAGLSSNVKEIRCFEKVDASLSPSLNLIFDTMGLGTNPKEKDLTKGPIASLYNAFFSEIFDYMANRLGTNLVSLVPEHELTLAPHDIHIKAGTISSGTVAATRWRWRGKFDNGTEMVHDILWTSSSELHKHLHREHWRIEIVGEPNVHADFGLSDDQANAPPGRELMISMATLLLNAIALVVKAPKGFFFDQQVDLSRAQSR